MVLSTVEMAVGLLGEISRAGGSLEPIRESLICKVHLRSGGLEWKTRARYVAW